jgi:hypothetical protein
MENKLEIFSLLTTQLMPHLERVPKVGDWFYISELVNRPALKIYGK